MSRTVTVDLAGTPGGYPIPAVWGILTFAAILVTAILIMARRRR